MFGRTIGSSICFGAFQNGRVTLNGQPIADGAAYTPPANATTVTFTVERVTSGQATTIPLTAVDECGSWPSVVGGGTPPEFSRDDGVSGPGALQDRRLSIGPSCRLGRPPATVTVHA